MGRTGRWLAVAVPGALVALAGLQLNAPGNEERAAGPPAPLTAEGVQSDLPVAPTTSTSSAPAPAAAPAPTTSTTTKPPSSTAATRAEAMPAATPIFTPPPGFESSVREIDPATAARMSGSWRPGCPVPLRVLRLVTITHRGFDGAPRSGELVVHAAHAEGIRRVFAELFAAGFPIEQVRLVDEFGGDDDRSMAANNTSAFNCRRVQGTTRWSQHAFGRAIDINPLQNPYLTRGGVRPPGGREFVRRDGSRQGLITARRPVVTAFARIGWRWGGAWASPDYQHFSANGR
jgi:hypothetical protein